MDNNKLGIACDHAGYELKEFLVGYLGSKGYDVYDFGTNSPESVDYPDYAHPLANAIEKGELPRGIALCGSANGITITLNKHQGIRAAICWEPEIAQRCEYLLAAGPLYRQRYGRENRRNLPQHRLRRRTPPTPHRQNSALRLHRT